MTIQRATSFSLVSAAAIDDSMTELAYSEIINRSGINTVDIGTAVLQALSKLPDPASIGQVIIHFSHDT